MSLSDLALVLVTTLVIGAPGLAVAAATGVRGWTLVAAAPLVTAGVVGLAGPASSALGVRWSAVPLLIATVVLVLIAAIVAHLLGSRARPPSPWCPVAHGAVAACVVGAAALGAAVLVRGRGGLRTSTQAGDSVFHVSGIRWITENGDAGLRAMARVAWYGTPEVPFYPNAFHLLGVVTHQLTGRDISSVVNVTSLVTLASLALGLVALVRRFGGRPVHAGASALVVVAAGGVYDLLWRGGQLPNALGVALVPAGLVLTADLLDATGTRARLRNASPFVLGLGGALALHPSTVVTLVLLSVPWVVARSVREPRRLLGDLRAALLAGVGTAVLYSAQLAGTVGTAGAQSVDWPAVLAPADAVGQILLFSHATRFPQWWLAFALIAGLLAARRLGQLNWVPWSALLVGGLFVAAASYDAPLTEAVTQPWWNDRFRLAAVVVVLLAIVCGHGIAEVSRVLAHAAVRLGERWRRPVPLVAASAVAALLVLVVLADLSGRFYYARNVIKLQGINRSAGVVSPAQVEGYRALATMVGPDERVMNQQYDGSVWMYPLAGVRPVMAYYDPGSVAPDAALLTARFRFYDSDLAVREAARRLGVRWVVTGPPPWDRPAPGLVDVARVDALREVWANGTMRIYRLEAS